MVADSTSLHLFFTILEFITMKSLALKMRRFLVSEDGPTAVEYAVMLALIVIVCLAAISAVGTRTSATFDTVSKSLGAS